MSKRPAFLVEVLDKIGAPLLAAVEAARAPSATAETAAQDAQTLAVLLTRAVEVSVALSQNMDLRGAEEDADSVRLALAALSGGLIAESYRAARKLPDDGDVRRLVKALEAVLTFSDNFAPALSHIARLRALDGQTLPADPDQNVIYVIQAMVPVMAAIAEFPFGMEETQMIRDVTSRLQERAAALTGAMLPPNTEMAPGKYVELMMLKSLAQIYAETHRSQTRALIAAGQQDGAGSPAVTLDTLWRAFDLQLAMLDSLVGAVLPVSGSSGSGAPYAPPPAAANTGGNTGAGAGANPMGAFVKKPQAAQDSAPPLSAAPAQAPATAAPAGSGVNPMAFFKPGARKQDDGG